MLSWAHTSVLCVLVEFCEREDGVVAVHLPTGPFNQISLWKPLPRCEPSTFIKYYGKAHGVVYGKP